MVKQNFLLFAASTLFVLLLSSYAAYAKQLPSKEKISHIVEALLEEEPASLVEGETGYAKNKGVKLWYEILAPKTSSKGSILLIMGHSAPALSWPPYFFQPLIDQGYTIIRADHRGLGMSDWLHDWQEANAYSIHDMVDDNITILDTLNIKQAHIIGFSAGGMIGQQLAISHPQRVESLTLIGSSGDIRDNSIPGYPGDPNYPKDFANAIELFNAQPLSTAQAIKQQVAIFNVFRGDDSYKTDSRWVAHMAYTEIHYRKGFNPDVSQQHDYAIGRSPARYAGLKQLGMPTLIIHGEKDPVIPIEHAKKMADHISDAATLYIDKLGHDITPTHTPAMLEAISTLLSSTDK